MPFGSSNKLESKPMNVLRISQPFDPRHMSAAPEPTLPRLTRLGPPTLHSLDTDVPPLPTSPLPQPGFKCAEDVAISPSVYSNASSASSIRRRSSTESAGGRSASSTSSASAYDSYLPFKNMGWGQGSRESPRKNSNSSEGISPKSSLVYGGQLSSGKYVPPRRPAGGQSAPRSQTPPQQYQHNLRPNGPPQPSPADPRTFLRNEPPPADRSYGRSSPDPMRPPFRGNSPVPLPPRTPSMTQRSNSPLARVRDNTEPPGLMRSPHHSPSSSLRNASMTSFEAPAPAFGGPGMHSPALTNRSTGTRTPPPFSPPYAQPPSSRTPQPPFTPAASQPSSPTELPLSETEITALWSHASLLYHNGRVADALDMLNKVVERPGASPLTLARLNLNVGIMTECLAKGRVVSQIRPHISAENMINAFEKAIKMSPDGPEGALGTFLLGCALFDSHHFEKSASCFDMCEAIFAGEQDTLNYRASANEPWNDGYGNRPSALQGGEKIDLKSLGIDCALYLSDVRENWRVSQERARIPAALGTMRELQRLPQGIIVEEPLPVEPVNLSPVDESDEEMENVRSTLGLRPDEGELIPMRLDLGGPPPPPQVGQQGPPPMRRRTTKKQDREEMERRREARRTRILIKLGDLRLNKPLPPLPHEREAMKRAQKIKTPEVPPLPVAQVQNGMPFV